MREQPGAWQMAAARITSQIFACKLACSPGIEDPYVCTEFGLQRLPVNKSNRSDPGRARNAAAGLPYPSAVASRF